MAYGLSCLTPFEYKTKVFRNVVVSQPKPQTVGKPKNLQMSTVIVITTDLWRWNRQSSETSSSANLSHTVGKPKNQETSFEWRRKLRNTVNQGPCRGPTVVEWPVNLRIIWSSLLGSSEQINCNSYAENLWCYRKKIGRRIWAPLITTMNTTVHNPINREQIARYAGIQQPHQR
jgi:hypothetical protein